MSASRAGFVVIKSVLPFILGLPTVFEREISNI
jgi:hypothetical protein